MSKPNLDGILTREFTIRETKKDSGRTIEALAVPYGETYQLGSGYQEKFAPGSIDDAGAILRYAHQEPIGLITGASDSEAGRVITARISNTPRGDEIVTLVRDGVLQKISIGFDGIEHLEEELEDGGVLITWTKVRAREYSIVEFPAYETTKISSIRTAQSEGAVMTTPDLTRADLDQLESAVAERLDHLERSVQKVSVQTQEPERPLLRFTSFGDWVRAAAGLSTDQTKIQTAQRAFDGATTVLGTASQRPIWLGKLEKRMAAKQVVTNMFAHTMDLPDEGVTVAYSTSAGDGTIKVGKQASEGEDLPSGKTSSLTIKTAPIGTYGGASPVSRQFIERNLSDDGLLTQTFEDLAFEYASEIEAQSRALFNETVTQAEAAPVTSIASALTVDEMIDAVIALLEQYDKTPYIMDGIAVSTAVFQELAHLPKDSKALQFAGAPDGHQGQLSIEAGSASFDALRIQRVPGWSGRHMCGFSQEAIRIRESAGAPLRLQQDNVVNLSRDFAVYGYAAHFAPHPHLIKAVKLGS